MLHSRKIVRRKILVRRSRGERAVIGFDQLVLTQLPEKRARLAGHLVAIAIATATPGDREILHRAGDTDVEQTPLLVPASLFDGTGMGKNPLLDSNDVTDGELKSLRRMHCDQ